jgi:hypothetical protein
MGAAFGYIDAPLSEPQLRTQRKPSGAPSESALVVARLAAVHEAAHPDPSLPRPGRIAFACAAQPSSYPEARLTAPLWADEEPDQALVRTRAEGAAAAHVLAQSHGLVILGHADAAASAPVPSVSSGSPSDVDVSQRRLSASRPAAV